VITVIAGFVVQEYNTYVSTGVNTSVSLQVTTQALLTLIQNFDLLLGSDINYLFGRFQAAAQALATNSAEVLKFPCVPIHRLWPLLRGLLSAGCPLRVQRS
jgi:hypothetical protein